MNRSDLPLIGPRGVPMDDGEEVLAELELDRSIDPKSLRIGGGSSFLVVFGRHVESEKKPRPRSRRIAHSRLRQGHVLLDTRTTSGLYLTLDAAGLVLEEVVGGHVRTRPEGMISFEGDWPTDPPTPEELEKRDELTRQEVYAWMIQNRSVGERAHSDTAYPDLHEDQLRRLDQLVAIARLGYDPGRAHGQSVMESELREIEKRRDAELEDVGGLRGARVDEHELKAMEIHPPAPADPWAGRPKGMVCSTCMYYVQKRASEARMGESIEIGRCRRRAPTMNGYPAVFPIDWCGDHKVDETKLG